jgi:hypothetical protein
MSLKNNKTFYLFFLFVVISLHTYILTTVLSVKKEANIQVNVTQIIQQDSLFVRKINLEPRHSQVPYFDNFTIKSFKHLQK